MIEAEIKSFSSRLGIGNISFDKSKPLCFILDGRYSYCLEYSKGNETYLNLTVEFSYDTYDLDFLEKAFASFNKKPFNSASPQSNGFIS